MTFARRMATQPWPAVGPLSGNPTRAEVFAQVLTSGPISRGVLAERLGLSPSTVTRLLAPLVEEGYLRETPTAATGLGRPERLLHVNTERHMMIGIQLAPTYVAAVLTDMAAQVISRVQQPIGDSSPASVLESAARLARNLMGEVPDAGERILGIGMGVSGHVNPMTGVCRYSSLLGWDEVDVATPLSAATGLPVAVNNDVNALVVTERWFGEGRGVESFAVITIGLGVGCGLWLNGALHSGASHMAGEFGHMPIEGEGPLCGCGSRGCLETFASCGAILRHMREYRVNCADFDTAVVLGRTATGLEGKAARAAFVAAGDALGRGLAGMCNLLNLERVIISGSAVGAHDLFGPALSIAMDRHAFSTAARDCLVSFGPNTDDLWPRGAACLVIPAALS